MSPIKVPLAGVLWYQGENNTNRPAPREAYRRQLAALAAVEIGVENEAVGAVALEQHHAQRRVTVRRRRCERHRIGVIGFAGARFGEPAVEQGKGIGDHGRGHIVRCGCGRATIVI